ncbi:MAG: competence/damage-inducible protein A [Myxococcota bacterium]
MPTAAAIIIGNEILSGKFADENGPFLIERLRALGVDLGRIVTIADDHDVIADEVRRASSSFDHVFTSGGVGPTHDDITLESVGAAFGEPMIAHPSLVKLLEAAGLSDEHSMRMATVPQSTELLWEGNAGFPVVLVHNVFVLPGVPKLFRLKFEAVADRFAGVQMLTRRIYTAQRETEIAAILSAAQDAFETVDIGSYPRFGTEPWRVIVTLESRHEADLQSCYLRLCDELDIMDRQTGANE